MTVLAVTHGVGRSCARTFALVAALFHCSSATPSLHPVSETFRRRVSRPSLLIHAYSHA